MLKKGKASYGNFARLQKLATYKFRRLRNFAGCEILQHCSPVHLLLFDLPFLWFYTSLPSCNLCSLAHFCNFPLLSTYISPVLLVIKSTFHSINQSRKFGTKLPLPLLLVICSSSPFTFLHFLGSQSPLDDEKSRDVRLKPPHP